MAADVVLGLDENGQEIAAAMNDAWIGAGLSHCDVVAFTKALALGAGHPLIAVLAGHDNDPELVLASRALFDLFQIRTGPALSERLLRGRDQGAHRLASLARSLPVGGAPRLERLRFSLGPGTESMTWLCRRIPGDGTSTILIAAALGLRPTTAEPPLGVSSDVASGTAPMAGAGERTTTDPAISVQLHFAQHAFSQSMGMSIQATLKQPAPPQAPSPGQTMTVRPKTGQPATIQPMTVQAMTVQAIQAALRARWPSKRAMRFLWQTDADAICTSVTPPLAEVVGIANADLVGRNLLELAPSLDPSGRLGEALAGRETWSGVDVAWPMTDTPAAIIVGLGAVPGFDREQTFEGFRGYGVIHLDRLIARDIMRLPLAASTPSRAVPDPNNVVAFPGSQKALSPEDQVAFDALGMELRDQAGIEHKDDTSIPSDEESSASAASPSSDAEAKLEQRASSEQPASVTASPSENSDPGAAPSSDRPHTDDPPAAGLPEPATPAEQSSAPAPSTDRSALIARNGLSVIDRLAVGLLVSRDNVPIFANRHLLDLLGFENEEALRAAGGLGHLFGGVASNVSGSEAVGVRAADGSIVATNTRMQRIQWNGEPAILLTLQPAGSFVAVPPPQGETQRASDRARAEEETNSPDRLSERLDTPSPDEAAWREDAASQAEAIPQQVCPQEEPSQEAQPLTLKPADDHELRELRAILETAADGIAVIDVDCNVLSLNRSAEALFGCDRATVVGKPFLDLFDPANQGLVTDYFEGLKSNATRSLLNDGRAILVKTPQGGTIPVFMTLGRLASPAAQDGVPAEGDRYCALFRDVTHWKKLESELEAARVAAERASANKTDVLAQASHEIRTPLSAIIGFAEIIMEERFGPIGNDRYRDYVRDIHASGTHMMSLVNDLLDLTKIEAGKMELAEEDIDANKVIGECVAMMQPRASRERVIMRLSLARTLPRLKADERSLRQIVLNLLSNAVKFNEPGGQVIVATTLTDAGQVVIRIRDTGPGMSEDEIKVAQEPFRRLSTRPQVEGTGLGLPLTRALVEANQATFTIRSKVDQGTLVEVVFPAARVLAG